MLLYEISIALTLTLMLVTTVFSLCYRYLLMAIAVFGIYSLCIVLLFVQLDAVDVAFTEAVVGGGFSLILFLCTLAQIRHGVGTKIDAPIRFQLLPSLWVLGFIGLMIYGTYPLPEVGDHQSPTQTYLAPLYLWGSKAQIDIPNVVTSVLASYRGYDTLGETAVIFCSALGVICLLTPEKPDHGLLSSPVSQDRPEPDSHSDASPS